MTTESVLKQKREADSSTYLSIPSEGCHSNYVGAVGYFQAYRPWPTAEAKVKAHVEEFRSSA